MKKCWNMTGDQDAFFFPSYLKEAPVLVARARSEFRQLPENRYRNIGLAATE
jgi:hypothetical protein